MLTPRTFFSETRTHARDLQIARLSQHANRPDSPVNCASRLLLWLTSKMSHDRGWRAACIVTIWILRFHSKMHEVARGVTAMVVGSGALLAAWLFLTPNPLPMTSSRFAGSTSAAFIRGFLSPTRNPESCHREPSFRKPVFTPATRKSNDSRCTRTDRIFQ